MARVPRERLPAPGRDREPAGGPRHGTGAPAAAAAAKHSRGLQIEASVLL